jgi:hypothetical protein
MASSALSRAYMEPCRCGPHIGKRGVTIISKFYPNLIHSCPIGTAVPGPQIKECQLRSGPYIRPFATCTHINSPY